MEQRYHALRTIGTIYRVMGYIVLVLTILAVIAICGVSIISGTALESASQQFGFNSSGSGLAGGLFGGLIASIFAILYGGFVALSLVALGEGIYILISIEENTRKTALIIDNQNKITPTETQP